MKRRLAFLLSLVMMLGFIQASSMASATSTLPLSTAVVPGNVQAYGANSFLASDCGAYSGSNQSTGAKAMAEVTNGTIIYGTGYNSGQYPQASCTANNASYVAPDGTVFLTEYYSDGGYLSAEKNGRILWKQKYTLCSSGSSGSNVLQIVMGSDGKLYVVFDNQNCGVKLIEVNPSDGTSIGSAYTISAANSSSYGIRGLYSYSGEIVVATTALRVLYFNNGSLSTPTTNSTAMTSGVDYHWWADAAETVYDTYYTGSNCSSSSGLKYRFKTRTASSSTVYSYTTDTNCIPAIGYYASGPNKSFVASQATGGGNPNTLTRYTVPSSGTTLVKTTLTATTPSGWYESPGKVYADTSGNALFLNTISDSSGNKDVIVRLYNFTNNTTSVVWRASQVITNQSVLSFPVEGSIYAGVLYQPICGSSCTSDTNSAKYYAINLGGFGSEVQSSGSFSPAYTVGQSYVALGDSYASGEGINDYIDGTAVASVNQCHRSRGAWPLQLEQFSTTKLNLTGFMACSGAKVSDIDGSKANTSTGNWSEGAQLDALSPSTKYVTISIGGNDIGFSDVVNTCVKTTDTQCDQQLNSINTSSVFNVLKSDLQSLITKVKNKTSTTTKIYIVGYPNLFPEYSTIKYTCTWGMWGTGVFNQTSSDDVTEYEVITMRSIHDKLNAAISGAAGTSGSNVTYVDPGAGFAGHEECTAEPYFNFIVYNQNTQYQAGSFHPNVKGVGAYSNALIAAIG